MKLRELTKIAERAECAREVLAALDKAQGIELDLLKADGKFVHYGAGVKILDDAVFIEGAKTYLKVKMTKILDDALAQLAEHGVEFDDPDPNVTDDEDDQEKAA
jgi:hypothetical protein